ncbi:MAG: M48 family metallopeptidase [Acidobacteria bacterium]|nr:M48 family metallopeptidase [Acidobacteriota bacterium]
MNEDKAARYHRLRRQASLLETLVVALALVLLLASGGSAALRAWAWAATGQSNALSIALYTAVVVLLSELLQVPLAFYQGVVLERRYDLSTQATGRWWGDRLRALMVGLPLAIAGAVLVWSLIGWTPAYWWVSAAVCLAILLMLMAHLAPVLLLPLFYRFTLLDRPALTSRLVALAERAGTQVLGVFEWRMSDRTRKANAALTGIGRTRRILLSDTLLAAHSDDEVEVILAHELAHHVHHDIWKAIALEFVLILVGFFLADRALQTAVGHFGISGKADIAGLPLFVLTGGAVSLLLLPVANAVSRLHERRADRYALDMTGNPAAFASAMKRLSVQNLAEERPSRWVEMFFHSHPSIAERIDAAHRWTRDSGLGARKL